MKTDLVLSEIQHKCLFEHLFSGDGKESVALMICNRRWGEDEHGLVTLKVISIPNEHCLERSTNRVVWPTGPYLLPIVEELEKNSQAVVIVHSHPEGYANFSKFDDENDFLLFQSVYGWFDKNGPHGAAIMLPDGRIFGRVVTESGTFRPFNYVTMIGSRIQRWPAVENTTSVRLVEGFDDRIQQAFGSATLSTLRDLTVGIVGCSGTGSVVFDQLLRTGVGRLVIVDPDSVELKNLNRIVNSRLEDAEKNRPKTQMLLERSREIGLGTNVEAIQASLLDARATKAIAGCDVIFGCMDSVEGRHVLNMIATAYLLPYFDLGVDLSPDGKGGLTHALAAVHYIPPGHSLVSRGVYTSEQLTADVYRRTDPKYFAENAKNGYLTIVGEDQPAVISLNSLAASLAVNDFLARLHGFRLDDDREYEIQRFQLTTGHYFHGPSDPCPVFTRWLGMADNVLGEL